MLFYILSYLGSIHQGLACCSISYYALAVSAEAWHAILYLISHLAKLAVSTKAWHAILYLITPWQYPPRLGMLFYILYHALAVSTEGPTSKDQSYSRTAKAQAPKTKDMKAQAKQTETCRRAGVRLPCGHAEEVVDFASDRGYLINQRCKFAKKFLSKIIWQK